MKISAFADVELVDYDQFMMGVERILSRKHLDYRIIDLTRKAWARIYELIKGTEISDKAARGVIGRVINKMNRHRSKTVT